MKASPIILSVTLVLVTTLRAQVVSDGATNTLSNVTNNFSSNVTVGTNGSFTLLVLSDNCLLTNSGLSEIGRNTSARSNEVRLISLTARWHMLNPLNVGLNGSFNRLAISNGASVRSSQGTVGDSSASASNNTVVINGAGSEWIVSTLLTVGLLGGGNRLEVSDGGRMSADSAFVGIVSSGNQGNQALVTGGNSVWSNATELTVGSLRGGNQLVVSDGGLAVNTTGYLGRGANGTNNLATITGTGSMWNNQSNLFVGMDGSANRLVISNGAVVAARQLFVGLNSSATNNRVVVDGGTLRVTNASGTAVLDVRRGTNVLNSGSVEADVLRSTNILGRFQFNGGTLSVRNTVINSGQSFSVGNGVSPATMTLAGSGLHSFANGLNIQANAALTGNGSIVGNTLVFLGGTLSPGASIGTLAFSSPPLLSGVTIMEISKSGTVLTNDRIFVSGTVTYNGLLTVTNIGPTALAAGDRFVLFAGSSYAGTFTSITLPPLPFGLVWLNNLLLDGSIEVVVATPPTVQTLPASAIGLDTATVNGMANPNSSETTAWFEFGFSTNYGNTTASRELGSGASNTNFSQVLTGLFGGVTYHFRAVASNNIGVVFGSDQSFGPSPAFADIGAGLPGVDSSQQDFFYSSGFTAWGDYDNDGRLDILLAGQGIVEIWRNNGAGFTNSGATPSLPISGCSAAWGDLDNDGRLDSVVTGRDGIGNVFAVVGRNTSNGFINVNTNLNALLLGVHAGAAVLGDYDNEGLLDVLMTGHNGVNARTEVWRNVGNGWSSINAGLSPAANSSAAWGDYDNDGRLDIMLNPSGIWRNTGSGFTNVSVGVTGVSHGSVAWGDYDNDGLLDLLQTGSPGANSSGAISRVWRNTGNGFTNINAGLPGVFRGAAAWGDYDNDGRLDIVLTGTTNDNILGNLTQLWRNTGNGFTNINAELPAVSRSSAAWGDYDNDGRLDILIAGVDGAVDRISQVWRNRTPFTNTPPTAPVGLVATVIGDDVILSWSAASDAQTPASGLTYNVRIGTTPGGSDVMGPMASSSGLRRLPQMGNAQLGLSATFNYTLGTPYYWSVQAVDSAFAGSPFSVESSFRVLQLPQPAPVLVPVTTTSLLNGDLNGDGIVDENELQALLADFFFSSPFLQLTNVAGLGGTNVTFALTNSLAGAFSVEYTTNFVDWYFLGPATPRYEFTDTNAPAIPQRYYRLRWP